MSVQTQQEPQVRGHISDTPSFLHLLVGFVAIQLQLLKRHLPLKKIFNLSGESTQPEEGGGAGAVGVLVGVLVGVRGVIDEPDHRKKSSIIPIKGLTSW